MHNTLWQPSASMITIKERAQLLGKIRDYFASQGVMEVETPILSRSATVDVYINSFATKFIPIGDGESQLYYLHTSPEFAMKRILSAGSGDIYSLGRVFRNGEVGERHNPEFTMLEWYRIGMNEHQLMDDVSALLGCICNFKEKQRCDYGDLFREHVGLNPYVASDAELRQSVIERIDSDLQELERNDCMDILFTHFVEPNLAIHSSANTLNGVFVYNYPVTAASLARTTHNSDGQPVAARFELFINGVELANGYHELLDAKEQKKRFQENQQTRQQRGYYMYPYDQHVIDALTHGMPDCAGVSIGIDRLLMLMLNLDNMADVMTFDFQRS